MPDYPFTIGDPIPGLDWEAVEDAFYDWIAGVTALDEDHIVWTDQGNNRPDDAAFVSLTLGDMVQVGIDATTRTYDAGAPLGEEITHTLSGPRVSTVRVQHYAGDATGAESSRAVLARAMTALRLPSVKAAFINAGVGILEIGPVRNIAGVQALQIEPRAVLEVRFCVQDHASEANGYVATAETSGTILPG